MINKDKQPKDTNFTSFKKFSEMTKSKKPNENAELSSQPEDDDDRPAFPNLPKEKGKMPKKMNTDYMMPSGQNVESDDDSVERKKVKKALKIEEEVQFYGKIAKLPKGVQASKGYSFLENVKVSKSSIWYLMVEKQDNELQMVKYNYKKGVDLSQFISELKEYYKTKFKGNSKLQKLIEAIHIDGNDKYSCVKNIPHIELEGKKMITKITEDLIKLLSK